MPSKKEQTIHPALSWIKNISPTIAGAIVSETELPIPWNILIIRMRLKSAVNPPQTVATNRIIDDRIRTGRRPHTLASGTQKMLPSPRRRTLSFDMVSNLSSLKRWNHAINIPQ